MGHLAVAAIPADIQPNMPQTSHSSLEVDNSQRNSESGMQGRSSKGRKLTGNLTVPVQGAGKWVSLASQDLQEGQKVTSCYSSPG